MCRLHERPCVAYNTAGIERRLRFSSFPRAADWHLLHPPGSRLPAPRRTGAQTRAGFQVLLTSSTCVSGQNSTRRESVFPSSHAPPPGSFSSISSRCRQGQTLCSYQPTPFPSPPPLKPVTPILPSCLLSPSVPDPPTRAGLQPTAAPRACVASTRSPAPSRAVLATPR